MSNLPSKGKGKVQLSTGTKGEFEPTCSVLLLTDDGSDWIDSIYDAEGEDAVEHCRAWAEREGYEIVPEAVQEERSLEDMCKRARELIGDAEEAMTTKTQRYITVWRKPPPDLLEWDYYTSESLEEAKQMVAKLKEQGVHQYATYELGWRCAGLSSDY